MQPPVLQPDSHPWLEWIKQVHALAQWGLTYSKDPFDLERYEVLKKLSVTMMADFTGLDTTRIYELFAHETGYVTPKVDVRGVVFRHGKILMVRESRDGLWTLPGGWADIGLSPSEAVAKEVWEEAGLTVKPQKLLALLDKKFFNHPQSAYHIYKLFIRCEDTDERQEPKGGLETLDAAFFAPDALPELSPHRATTEQIALLFQHERDPQRPTDFS